MKTLYLLRHAKAIAAGGGVGDEARPLSERGREACGLIGAYMQQKAYAPARVLSSTSVRTRQTVKGVFSELEAEAVQWVDALYLAGPEKILQIVQNRGGDAQSVMVVGHNPGLHVLALALASPTHTELRMMLEMKYPTGALCVLRFEVDDWQDIAPGSAELVDFVAPREL
jgi:phosphohistidine phosphatase